MNDVASVPSPSAMNHVVQSPSGRISIEVVHDNDKRKSGSSSRHVDSSSRRPGSSKGKAVIQCKHWDEISK